MEIDRPTATGRDLLVKIEAIAVNPVDTKVRAPKPQVEPAPRVLGWDAAGTVAAVGPEVTLFKLGDPVYYAGSITRPGTNAEYHLVDERIVGHKPASLDFANAAALPLTAITAWEALFDRLGVSPKGEHAGRSVLIIGGAGGVGSIGIQLAKVLAGLTVIATASRPESQEWCRRLGADHTVDHRGDLPAQLKALGFAGVDYILCFNDTDGHFPAMAELIAPQGKICTIVENARPLPVERLKSKSATFVWEFMFTRACSAPRTWLRSIGCSTRWLGWWMPAACRPRWARTWGASTRRTCGARMRRWKAGRPLASWCWKGSDADSALGFSPLPQAGEGAPSRASGIAALCKPQPILLRMSCISSLLKARRVCVRTLPAAPMVSPKLVMVASSGASTVSTTSYLPSVQ